MSWEVEYELARAGSPSGQNRAAEIRAVASQPHRFVSPDGYVILAGKNNRQNDLLTMKTAEPDDIWLHTGHSRRARADHRRQGACARGHAIGGGAIAAYLSRAKNGGKVAGLRASQKRAQTKRRAARHGGVRELPDHTGKPRQGDRLITNKAF